MLKKNNFFISLFFIILTTVNYSILLFSLSIYIDQQISTILKAISIQKSYQGLVLDTSGIAPILINLLEKDGQILISNIEIEIKGGQGLKRKFSKKNTFSNNISELVISKEVSGIKVKIKILISTYFFFILLLISLFISIAIFWINLLIKRWRLKEEQSKLTYLACQVAHDIRSPLAALKMAVKDICNIPEDQRVMIRSSINRIQDIANDLLINQSKQKQTQSTVEKPTVELISSLLDNIITEKRLQYRSQLAVEIEFSQLQDSYGTFALVDALHFKRVLSNIINNAVEAFDLSHPGSQGKVRVSLTQKSQQILIIIEDNGKGIPQNVLAKIGTKSGETHGKKSGSGLGLYHAKLSLEAWNGNLSIQSEVGVGTIVHLTIPKTKAPSWFVPELKIVEDHQFVILDDDSAIHQIWTGRLPKEVKTYHFSLPEQMKDWFFLHKKNNSNKKTTFLFDYELLGHKQNGIDLIEELGIAKNSILVTSHFEEKDLLDRCQLLGIKLIPKSMAELIPISMVDHHEFDVVYIDDDDILRRYWKRSAEKSEVKLLLLSSTKEFYQHRSSITFETPIYIDRELGSKEPKGEDFAQELSKQGYHQLFLATGYDAHFFPEMPWIKGIISKEAPWESDHHDVEMR
jgi:signal transduction histidine kinase